MEFSYKKNKFLPNIQTVYIILKKNISFHVSIKHFVQQNIKVSLSTKDEKSRL